MTDYRCPVVHESGGSLFGLWVSDFYISPWYDDVNMMNTVMIICTLYKNKFFRHDDDDIYVVEYDEYDDDSLVFKIDK